MRFWWLEVIGGIERKRQYVISFPFFFRKRVRNRHPSIFSEASSKPTQVQEQDGDLSLNPAILSMTSMKDFSQSTISNQSWHLLRRNRTELPFISVWTPRWQPFHLNRVEPPVVVVWTTCSHYVFDCVQAACTGYQAINMEAWHSSLYLTWQL